MTSISFNSNGLGDVEQRFSSISIKIDEYFKKINVELDRINSFWSGPQRELAKNDYTNVHSYQEEAKKDLDLMQGALSTLAANASKVNY